MKKAEKVKDQMENKYMENKYIEAALASFFCSIAASFAIVVFKNAPLLAGAIGAVVGTFIGLIISESIFSVSFDFYNILRGIKFGLKLILPLLCSYSMIISLTKGLDHHTKYPIICYYIVAAIYGYGIGFWIQLALTASISSAICTSLGLLILSLLIFFSGGFIADSKVVTFLVYSPLPVVLSLRFFGEK